MSFPLNVFPSQSFPFSMSSLAKSPPLKPQYFPFSKSSSLNVLSSQCPPLTMVFPLNIFSLNILPSQWLLPSPSQTSIFLFLNIFPFQGISQYSPFSLFSTQCSQLSLYFPLNIFSSQSLYFLIFSPQYFFLSIFFFSIYKPQYLSSQCSPLSNIFLLNISSLLKSQYLFSQCSSLSMSSFLKVHPFQIPPPQYNFFKYPSLSMSSLLNIPPSQCLPLSMSSLLNMSLS